MLLNIYQVDSSTTEPFKGNPAGVCITESALPESLMLSIAQEMSVSETAFLNLSSMQLRWFTPTTEVELCGHATLATIHIMNELGLIHKDQVARFQTLSGELLASLTKLGYEMDFPIYTVLSCEHSNHHELTDALGLEQKQITAIGMFGSKHLIEVINEQTVTTLQPNFVV